MNDDYGIEIPGTPWERARSGMLFGAALATAGALYVVGLYLLRGSTPFDGYGVTLPGVILAYYGAGLVAGAALGVLWPLRRSRAGAAVVGAVGGFISYGAVGISMAGSPTSWTAIEWAVPVGLGSMWAILSATVLYRPPRPRVPPPAPSRLRTVRPPAQRHDST